MSDTKGNDIQISASVTDEQLLDYLLKISSGITPSGLMTAIADLPDGANTKKIGSLAVGASMNIRKVINDVRAKAGIALPESWQVNSEINFSMMAMTGHVLFLLPAEMLTAKGAEAQKAYIKSIGGVANISMFTDSSVIEGKEKRSTILLKWAGQLKGFDATKHQTLLARKFPNIVKDKRGITGRMIDAFLAVISAIFYPFRLAYAIMRSVTRNILPMLILAALLYVVSYALLASYFPRVSYVIADTVHIDEVIPRAASLPEALSKAASATPAIALNTAKVASNAVVATPSAILAVAGLAYDAAASFATFSVEAYTTQGASAAKAYEEFDVNNLMAPVAGLAGGLKDLIVFTLARVFLGTEVPEEKIDIGAETVEVFFNAFTGDVMSIVEWISTQANLPTENASAEADEEPADAEFFDDIPVAETMDNAREDVVAALEEEVLATTEDRSEEDTPERPASWQASGEFVTFSGGLFDEPPSEEL